MAAKEVAVLGQVLERRAAMWKDVGAAGPAPVHARSSNSSNGSSTSSNNNGSSSSHSNTQSSSSNSRDIISSSNTTTNSSSSSNTSSRDSSSNNKNNSSNTMMSYTTINSTFSMGNSSNSSTSSSSATPPAPAPSKAWLSGLHQELQASILPTIQTAWDMAVGNDLKFEGAACSPDVRQQLESKGKWMGAAVDSYMSSVFQLARFDPLVGVLHGV